MLTEMGWVSSYGLEISEGVCMVRFRALDATTDARCMFQKQKKSPANSIRRVPLPEKEHPELYAIQR